MSVAVAEDLLHGLLELGIRNSVAFTLDDTKGLDSLFIAENQEISTIHRDTVGHGITSTPMHSDL
jgi:hypothetical protein